MRDWTTDQNVIFEKEGALLKVIEGVKVAQSIEDFWFRGKPVNLKPMLLDVRECTESDRKEYEMKAFTIQGGRKPNAAIAARKRALCGTAHKHAEAPVRVGPTH